MSDMGYISYSQDRPRAQEHLEKMNQNLFLLWLFPFVSVLVLLCSILKREKEHDVEYLGRHGVSGRN